MSGLFLNPFTFAAGLGLVAAPILIHLINRLRFRRVRWAAMEFLLKADKRNRRRLLLEQLLLLLLRCLLVVLLGLLGARYVGSALGLAPPRGTLHVVILDDTASTGDYDRAEGSARTAFDRAKRAILDDIVKGAGAARTPQSLELVRLTLPEAPVSIERINESTIEELQRRLNDLQPTALRVGWGPALDRAAERFAAAKDLKHVLHVVSDFRARDWSGPEADSLAKSLADLTAAGVTVHFLDAAEPTRGDAAEVPDHGNLGVAEFQPASRFAARYLPHEFTLGLANFTGADRQNVRVAVRVNGAERADSSVNIPVVKTGLTRHMIPVTFDRTGWNVVAAGIEPDDAGLLIDDVRYAAVEVVERVPLLFVEGDPSRRGKADSAGYYLAALFRAAAPGFEVVERSPADLEQLPLSRYAAIYMLNVPRLGDNAKANVDAFVAGGGGLFVALGDRSDAEFYTKWHAEGKGLFPAPVSRATDPPTPAEREAIRTDPERPMRAFVRTHDHPLTQRLYRDDPLRETNAYLKYLFIDRHVPVPRSRWERDPARVAELLTLPNNRQIGDYADEAQRLLRQLPLDDPKFAAYRNRLNDFVFRIRNLLIEGKPLHQLADAAEAMLTDAADPKSGRPNLQEFWSQQPQLRDRLRRFIDSARYGDPLLIASSFGRGRVLTLLTTADASWTDWPSGLAQPYYVMLMLEGQHWLSGGTAGGERLVGSPLQFTRPAAKFEAKARVSRLTERDGTIAAADFGEQAGAVSDDRVSLPFAAALVPGVYRFEFTPRGEADRVDVEAVAVNVDTLNEGDLRRAGRDELEAVAPTAKLHAPGSGLADLLKDRQADLSESPWLFLLLLGVLVAEQALAVRLSFHVKKDK